MRRGLLNKGTNWHASNVVRKLPTFEKLKEKVGPGSYEVKGSFPMKNNRSRSFIRENKSATLDAYSESESSECETQSEPENVPLTKIE